MAKKEYKYDEDFNIHPRPTVEAVEEMRKRGQLEFGAITVAPELYTILRIPYLSPRTTAEKRRFEHIKSTYLRERKKLRKLIRTLENKCFEWVIEEQCYMIIHPNKIVGIKRSRVNRSMSGVIADAYDSIESQKNWMDSIHKREAKEYMDKLANLEGALKGK